MTKSKGMKLAEREADREALARALDLIRRQPEALLADPDVLSALTDSLESEASVVDIRNGLIARQARALAEAEAQQAALLRQMRQERQLQDRVHAAARSLLAAESFEELMERASSDLPVMLHLDCAILAVERQAEEEEGAPPLRLGGVMQVPQGQIDRLLGDPLRDLDIRNDGPPPEGLFPRTGDMIRAHALVRLTVSMKTPPALLALGSRQADVFAVSNAASSLQFLAAVLGELLRAWLFLPR